MWTPELHIADNAFSAPPVPRQALPTVLGHKKRNDDVLICEHLLQADSVPPTPPPLSPDVPDADDDTGLMDILDILKILRTEVKPCVTH